MEVDQQIDVRMGIGGSPGQGPFEVNWADAGLLDEMRDDVRHYIPLGLQGLIVDAWNTHDVQCVVTSSYAFVQVSVSGMFNDANYLDPGERAPQSSLCF